MNKLILAVAILCLSISVFASSPYVVYKKLVAANKFWAVPQLGIYNSDKVQAVNMGPVILIYKGMLRAVRNDDELALVLGHELAHGKLWHWRSSHDNEYAADRLGAEYMQKAGYNRCAGVRMLLMLNKEASLSHPAAKNRWARLKCPS